MRVRLPILSLLVVAALPCAQAEDGAAAASLLARGRWRLEGELPSSNVDARVVPRRPVLRLGASGAVELRAERGGVTLETRDAVPAADPDATDFDLLGGARWRVRAGNAGGFPGTAWLAGGDASSPAWRAAGSRPSARATAEWSLPSDVTVGITPGLLVDRDDDGHRRAAGLLALTLGKRWASHWRGLVGVTGKSGGADVPLTLDAGLGYRATDALQFDLSVSHGVAGGAPDLQAGLGLSARF